MYRNGHVGIGIALYAPVAFWLVSVDRFAAFAVGLVCVTVLSYAPDFDLWLPLVTHRGATHTVLAALVVSLVLGTVTVVVRIQGAPLLSVVLSGGFVTTVSLVGYLGHLLGDLLTPMGIRPFRPLSQTRYSLDLVTAGDDRANRVLGAAGLIALVVALVLGIDVQDGTIDVLGGL